MYVKSLWIKTKTEWKRVVIIGLDICLQKLALDLLGDFVSAVLKKTTFSWQIKWIFLTLFTVH